MGRTEQHEVVERGLPALGPVLNVMAVQAVGSGAAGEAAPLVAARERSAYGWGDAAGAPPDAERFAVGTIHHGDDSRIAAQPSGSLRRDGGAVLDFTAPRASVREHFGLDMDHDFVPVRRKRRRIARFEHPFGHPRQRIGAAHRARRPSVERPTWDVGQEHLGVFSPVGSHRFRHIGIGGRIGGGRVLVETSHVGRPPAPGLRCPTPTPAAPPHAPPSPHRAHSGCAHPSRAGTVRAAPRCRRPRARR